LKRQSKVHSSFEDELRATLEHSRRPEHIHNSFRFPARLHSRVSSAIISHFSRRGDIVCDPFMGSGTNLVEAALANRNSVGFDVDPLAVFVTRGKLLATKRLASTFNSYADSLLRQFKKLARTTDKYRKLARRDIGKASYDAPVDLFDGDLLEIIERWFRRYVVEDLAIIRRLIDHTAPSASAKHLALLAFASAIRNCSNADPVPVSGLEYTKRMRQLDASGRVIDPFTIVARRLGALAQQANAFSSARQSTDHRVHQRDAAETWNLKAKPALIFFSPPYLNAVEYSRRHKLEMIWLSLISSRESLIRLSHKYIGGPTVGREPLEECRLGIELVDDVRQSLLQIDYRRARSFVKYCKQLQSVFKQIDDNLSPSGYCVVVVGNNRVAGLEVPLSKVLVKLAPINQIGAMSYDLRDRYMSYSRHNGADINREHILVFKKSER
jgi:DNA methylase